MPLKWLKIGLKVYKDNEQFKEVVMAKKKMICISLPKDTWEALGGCGRHDMKSPSSILIHLLKKKIKKAREE